MILVLSLAFSLTHEQHNPLKSIPGLCEAHPQTRGWMPVCAHGTGLVQGPGSLCPPRCWQGWRQALPLPVGSTSAWLCFASCLSATKAGADDSDKATVKMRRTCGGLAICRIRVLVTDLFQVPRNPYCVRNEPLADVKVRAQWRHWATPCFRGYNLHQVEPDISCARNCPVFSEPHMVPIKPRCFPKLNWTSIT